MNTRLNPYISFKDTAREAMTFYQTVLGGELTMNSFGEAGMQVGPEAENNIMHAMLETSTGMALMAADTPPGMEYSDGARISISLSGDNEEELRGYFEKLSEGGTVLEPFVKAPWGDLFGMTVDKFGVMWMVNCAAAQHDA